MAGASTCFRLMLPYSASMVMSPPGVPGVTAASGPNSGGYRMPSLWKYSGVAPVGATPEAVDGDDLAGVGVIDERLGLAAPGQRVPHGRGGGDHGAGGVHGVAALLEDHGAGGGGERLAGHGHPVAAVERGLLGATFRERAAEYDARGHHGRERRTHQW